MQISTNGHYTNAAIGKDNIKNFTYVNCEISSNAISFVKKIKYM